MVITPQDLGDFLAELDARARAHEQALNAADARLGDGDTGSMLRRVLAAIAAAPVRDTPTLSKAAMIATQAAMKETGSSLGTLVATATVTLAKQAQSRNEALEAKDMAQVVAAMRDAVSARGKAEPGDKTIVDSLDAIARQLGTGPVSIDAARAGAEQALAAFRDRPCRIGRARMFPDRSTGADDPGMLAVALLLGATPSRSRA